jgi:hypothetical protein
VSSTFFQALAGSASGSSGPECEPSVSARSTAIAGGCCDGTGQMSLFGETSGSSPRLMFPTPRANKWGLPDSHGSTAAWSMSSAAAFPAKISPSPERARALRASAAGYGRSTPELLARYDRATSSWRTSQLCLDGDLSEFSETWPRSGLMRNGIAYQLPPLVRLTDETGSGLWPTPAAVSYGTNQGGGMGRVGPIRPSLETMARQNLWPTADRYSGLQSYGQNAILGSLNPTWVEWLMGFPLGWTDLGR